MNLRIDTLLKFLQLVREKEPINFYMMIKMMNPHVRRSIKFCLEHKLIEIVKTKHRYGPFPSKYYALTNNGLVLLGLFERA